MAPVAKRNRPLTPIKGQTGQITIFFSASLVVLITIVAFVVNVGLFVKAKINLQNATDAAAYAGAATQARQLTKIAHLNWEMRNIYKEWMFKYYVIGNLNIEDVKNANGGTGSGTMSYQMLPDVDSVFGTGQTVDPYNLPAVCIHLEGSKTNICRRYAIPGLPEFGSSNLPGAEEASRAFMDNLIGAKINDCVDRTKLNMLVAATWAFNVMTDGTGDTLASRGPAIMTDRQGAWPQAVELAMRIRNLEFAMNRKPQTDPICLQPGAVSTVNCSKSIDEIKAENRIGNERIIKAYFSGLRNIGGNDEEQDEMKNTFTLTEIAPKPVVYPKGTDSSMLLIPSREVGTLEKYYVDLKLMLVNLATFYAAMIPRADSNVSGACDVSKAAIPIPGYPLGFYKNQNILTYYAVRGEAAFVGMFNPFQTDAVKMTAYAAAKPMGGRIGPMLFFQRDGEDAFKGRNDTTKRRTVPYIATLDVVGTLQRFSNVAAPRALAYGEFAPGVPLPINMPGANFWFEDGDKAIGGLIQDQVGVQFGIPNLVYDYETPWSDAGYSLPSEKIFKIQSSQSTLQPVGLFSKYQLARLKGVSLGTSVGPDVMNREIARVRAPTMYEAGNYLIPTPNSMVNNPPFSTADEPLDTIGTISGQPNTSLGAGVLQWTTAIYAPLYKTGTQTDILFQNQGDVLSTIYDFMRAQESGINKYRDAMNAAARAIWETRLQASGSAAGSQDKYGEAARGVSDINLNDQSNAQTVGSCRSIAGQFLYFYYGTEVFGSDNPYVTDESGCPKSLPALLGEYFSPGGGGTATRFSPTHYVMNYNWYEPNFAASPTAPKGLAVHSAYVPGPFTGVGFNGLFDNPIPGSNIREMMRRNSYSTKFIALESLKASGPGYSQSGSNFLIMSEGDTSSIASEVSQRSFLNPLEPGPIDISSIKH
jgi:hypothetical protein